MLKTVLFYTNSLHITAPATGRADAKRSLSNDD